MQRNRFRIMVFAALMVPLLANVASAQTKLVVTVAGVLPTPYIVTTGQSTTATFNIAFSAPQNVATELQQHGAAQQYTVQLSNSEGPSEGTPVSITFSGATLKDNGRIGDFDVTFDRPHNRINIGSWHNAPLLTSVAVVASFATFGDKLISFDGQAIIDGTTYVDDDGGRARVTVVDFHIRADTNRDSNITAADDATSLKPGLFVAFNADDDNSNGTPDWQDTSQVAGENDLKPARMILDPLPASTSNQCYVKLSRSTFNARVWRTSDKSEWNGLTGRILVADNSNTWDLTNSDSRTRFVHDKDNLAVEGFNTGACTLTLDWTDSSLTAILSDSLLVNCWGVEIEVNNTPTPDDDIVCRRSTTPAGRPELPCHARVCGAAQAMTVYLDNGGAAGTGQLRYGTTQGNVTAQNLTLSLPAGANNNPGAWVDFRISGETESAAMRDAIVRAKQDDANGQQVGQATATVLWVTITWTHAATDTISNENAARQGYYTWARPNTYNLGPHTYSDRIGWGMEYRGEVKPSDFTRNVVLARDWEYTYYRDANNGSTQVLAGNFGNPPPGNDTGPLWARDDTPAIVYDFDAAGIPNDARPQGTVYRFRSNFHELASFDYGGGNVVRCSDDLIYFIRMSYRQAGPGQAANWQPLNDVNNDNQVGGGTTGINWNSTQ